MQPFPLCITNQSVSLFSFFYSNVLPNRALSRLLRPLTQQPFPLCITNQSVSLFSFFYSNVLPNRALSRLLRPLTQQPIPQSWRPFLFKLFGKIYPIEWSDFNSDLSTYC